jgi:hypothetical protein
VDRVELESERLRAATRGLCVKEVEAPLLAVALAETAAGARASWQSFRSRHELDALSAGAVRLLPAACERLHALGVEDAESARLAGIRRYLWVRSQLTLAAARDAAELLRAASIESLGLKGLALVHVHAAPVARRPLLDADLAVRPREFDAAARVLRDADFRVAMPSPHAVLFRRGRVGVDLHRWPLHQDPRHQAWDNAVPLPDQPFLAEDATDLLIHLCVHGVRAESSALWVLDARRVLHSSSIAWERVVTFARERRFGLILHDTLGRLPDVPAAVMASLRALRVTPVEALEYRGIVGVLPGRRGYACRMSIRTLTELRRRHPVLTDALIERAVNHHRFLSLAEWLTASSPRPGHYAEYTRRTRRLLASRSRA